MGLRSRFWKARGEVLGVAKAKKDDSPWMKSGHPHHHQSHPQLCSAPPRLMVELVLHAPREAEPVRSVFYSPTTMTAEGSCSPSSISASHMKLPEERRAHVPDSSCMTAWKTVERTHERTLSTSSTPCRSPCDTLALKQHESKWLSYLIFPHSHHDYKTTFEIKPILSEAGFPTKGRCYRRLGGKTCLGDKREGERNIAKGSKGYRKQEK